MSPGEIATVALLMAAAAALYSAVGHGGASAYLAIMALFAFPAEVMRPTALALNLLVAGIAAVGFLRAGQFNPRLFALVAVAAVPFAFLGGLLALPNELYRPLVGVLLWLAALRLLWSPVIRPDRPLRPPAPAIAVPAGAAIGLLAGLTGTGGGIFLSPLALLLRWEAPRRISGTAAGFIFVNSAAGLAGTVTVRDAFPQALPLFLLAVALGAAAGSWLGVERLLRRRIEQALGLVLIIAGAKLVLF